MKRVILVLAGVALLFALAGCLSMDSGSAPFPTPEVIEAVSIKTAETETDPAETFEVPPALRDRLPRSSEAVEITTIGGFTILDPIEVPTLELSDGATEAYCEGEGANMRLTLPEGWDYELVSEAREAGEDWDAYENFGIRFWPTDRAGSITLWYYPRGFGVCGTGLTSQKVVFSNGLTANRGRWGGNWDYISFQDTPGSGSYVAKNSGLDSNGLNTAMEILGTAVLGEGISE